MEITQEEIFSKVLRAGRRTYFFDVRETKASDYYLTITESKKYSNNDGTFFYKKHKIYLYKEDFSDGGVLVDDLMPGLAEVESLKAGTWDIEILDELTPNEGETVVDKNRPSAYYNTNLNEWLEGNNLSQIILCGVTTSICVETTTRDLSQEDYRVVIASDAVNELEPDRHEVALKTLAFGFAWVNSVDEIISRMN